MARYYSVVQQSTWAVAETITRRNRAPRVHRRPRGADDQEQNRRGEMEWGGGPSVLLAISQRNMWVREDHACTSSGPLLIRGSARSYRLPTRGRDPAVCQAV